VAYARARLWPASTMGNLHPFAGPASMFTADRFPPRRTAVFIDE